MTRKASNLALADTHGFKQMKTRIGLLQDARFGLQLFELVTGKVSVDELFEVERYPSVWQMTKK